MPRGVLPAYMLQGHLRWPESTAANRLQTGVVEPKPSKVGVRRSPGLSSWPKPSKVGSSSAYKGVLSRRRGETGGFARAGATDGRPLPRACGEMATRTQTASPECRRPRPRACGEMGAKTAAGPGGAGAARAEMSSRLLGPGGPGGAGGMRCAALAAVGPARMQH